MSRSTGIILAIFGLIVIGAGILIFANNADDETTNTTTQPDTTEQTEDQTQDETEQTPPQNAEQDEGDAAQTLTIDMSNYEFSVEEIEATPGETVTVNLTNSGGTHNFTVDELDVASRTINTGERESVTFRIPEEAAGETYAFYCSVGNHRALGMEGQIVISQQ